MTKRATRSSGKFDFLSEERQQREDLSPVVELEQGLLESAQASKSTNAHASNEIGTQANIERRPSGQRIRADLLRAMKILSAQTGTPQYVLIEEAIEQYLAQKRTS